MGKMCAFSAFVMILVVAVSLGGGCAAQQTAADYHTVLPSTLRSTERAKAFNEQGLGFVKQGDFDAAEGAFREALQADMSYAAAHNNLGLALLERGRLYEAALELSYAGKLDPQAIEPIVNLARLYESVGWSKAAKAERQRAALMLSGSSLERAKRASAKTPRYGLRRMANDSDRTEVPEYRGDH